MRLVAALGNPTRPLRAAVERWIAERTPRLPGPVTITRRRIYILPTRFGYGYAGVAFVMLLGAMNYSNSMAFALAFLLAGIGLAAMYHTHGNLVNLEVQALRTPPVFAGGEARIAIELTNPTRHPRYAVSVAKGRIDTGASADPLPGQPAQLELHIPAPRRGWLAVPRFAIRTEFPLGLFRAWAWVELDHRVLVYPHPDGRRPPRPAAADCSGRHRTHAAGSDDFAGLRPYRPGDRLQAIHWKSLSRLADPLVKIFDDPRDTRLWLDWEALAPMGVEARLSQLSRWVVTSDACREHYGLRLPGTRIAPAQGAGHRHACLRALALFERPS